MLGSGPFPAAEPSDTQQTSDDESALADLSSQVSALSTAVKEQDAAMHQGLTEVQNRCADLDECLAPLKRKLEEVDDHGFVLSTFLTISM